MRSRVDEQLRREVREFALRFTCDTCIHFEDDPGVQDAPNTSHSCEHGYPTEPHRVRLELVTELSFCKDYELA
jgi:hypothetical protein